MDRRVTAPKRVTSPTWDPPPPCKQAQPVLVTFRSRGTLDSSSRPTLLTAAVAHTSYSLLVHRLARPRADSPISDTFRLIWLCVRVFRVRIYYYYYYFCRLQRGCLPPQMETILLINRFAVRFKKPQLDSY